MISTLAKFLSWNFKFFILVIFGITPYNLIGSDNHVVPTNNRYRFIENKGQWKNDIFFTADIDQGALFLEARGFVYHFMDRSSLHEMHGGNSRQKSNLPIKSHAFKVNFVGSAINPEIVGENKIEEYYNYFIGNDPKKWASHANAYTKINYNELYKGINLDVYAMGKQLKYDFVVEPNADANQIKLNYVGVDKLYLEYGQLVIQTSVVTLREKSPVAYQIIGQRKVPVPCKFVLKDKEITFDFPTGYNHGYQLVIDPELIFSTYSGSRADNFGYTATFDSDGFLYSGSSVFGVGYPTTLGAYQENFLGLKFFTDFAITKYDTTGTQLIYSTLIGGAHSELPHSIIANNAGEIFIYGTTGSSDFPLVNPIQSKFNGGDTVYFNNTGVYHPDGVDLYVCKLNSDGSQLLNSTFMGGSRNDGINSLATNIPYRDNVNGYLNFSAPLTYNYADEFRGEIDLDNEGSVFITTCTASPDFPTTAGALQPTFAGGGLDGCIVKFNASLSQVEWSTYLGGTGVDALYSIDFDSINQVYVAGGTSSLNLPTQPSSLQRLSNRGRAEGYVAKINKNGSSILSSTYWGNFSYDQVYFVELDHRANIYVFGQAEDAGNYFIRKNPLDPVDIYSVANGGQFLSKFSNDLTRVVWSTSFGTPSGSPNISPTAFLVDLCSKVYLSGWGGETNTSIKCILPISKAVVRTNRAVTTTGLPTTTDAHQRTTDGSDFYLMVLADDASKLVYGSFFGGNLSHEHVDGGTSRFDRKGKIYQSVCAGCGGNSDFPIAPPNAWSAKNNSTNCNNAVFKFDFNLPIVLSDFKYSGCNPIFFTNNSLIQKATTFQWKFGDGKTSTDRTPTHTYAKSGNYKVTLIVRDQLTCNLVDSVSKLIYVSPLYDGVSASANPTTIYRKKTTTLSAQPNTGNYAYLWSPSGVLATPTKANTAAKPTDTTTFQVDITDPINNCSYSARVTVNVISIICGQPDIFVPNAFTPNGDLDNEVLKVRGNNIENMNFAIYDRWGEKVFETKDQTKGWDGTFKGKKLDPDVYVYYLEGVCIDEEKFMYKGNITLIR